MRACVRALSLANSLLPSDIKLYSLHPRVRKLKLTLKSSGRGIESASPGGVLPDGVKRRECAFVWATAMKVRGAVGCERTIASAG